ncbi:hypothetical protein F4775DRAFT_596799 [Biscogniauxia sp. FL1348]|nr:hypothetical protein F4775DRAFT_596799 [Biscogniauxia sp. FL1348]
MASIPSTMKGIVIEKTGGTEVLQYKTDLPVPELADGQVLIKNDFIGVNFIDTYFRTGLYPAPRFPYVLGREGAGTVVRVSATGPTYGLKEGDRVAWSGEGAYAEYSANAAERTFQLPPAPSSGSAGVVYPRDAAASLLQGLTALTLIREAHPVQPGDWVLVHAAAGGTGLLLCQLLRAVGARTIGTVSTPAKADLARAAGADHVIQYADRDSGGAVRAADVKAKVLELTGGKGCAAVFDGVGRATFDLSLECVARKGSVVSFGNASGAVPPVNIMRLAAKNARLLRPTLFNYLVDRAEFEPYVAELFGFLASGALKVSVHHVYPLSQVARAHADLEGRLTTGKLLLDPSK